jgi:hypothetical protein
MFSFDFIYDFINKLNKIVNEILEDEFGCENDKNL